MGQELLAGEGNVKKVHWEPAKQAAARKLLCRAIRCAVIQWARSCVSWEQERAEGLQEDGGSNGKQGCASNCTTVLRNVAATIAHCSPTAL